MKIAAFCLCWIMLLTAPGVMAQQTILPNQSWDVLSQLWAGEKLEVERKVGKKKVSGKLISLSDTELVIERKGKTESFKRDEVKKVWQVTPLSGTKKTILGAIGGGLGFLAALPIAAGLAFGPCGDGCADEGAGIVAALIGLPIVGVFVGIVLAGKGKRTLIYSAP